MISALLVDSFVYDFEVRSSAVPMVEEGGSEECACTSKATCCCCGVARYVGSLDISHVPVSAVVFISVQQSSDISQPAAIDI